MTTLKLPCACRSEFQDQQHGTGLRLHNQTKKGEGTVYRCTVCGTERTRPGKAKTAKVKTAEGKDKAKDKSKSKRKEGR